MLNVFCSAKQIDIEKFELFSDVLQLLNSFFGTRTDCKVYTCNYSEYFNNIKSVRNFVDFYFKVQNNFFLQINN
jgi:hypothetical protein